MMYNMYPYNGPTQNRFSPYQPYQPYQQMAPIQHMPLKGRVVTSFDEAKAAMIDLDGSVHFFPDTTNRVIYTKQINLDGTASLNTYVLSTPQESPPVSPDSSPGSSELVALVNPLISEVTSLLDDLRQLYEEMKNNVQSYANYADVSKPSTSSKQSNAAKPTAKSAVSKGNADG